MNPDQVFFETKEGHFDLSAVLTRVGTDIAVMIYGGERPHIGAVALAQARPSLKNQEEKSATASVLCILGHKEDAVVKYVSERLAAAANCSVVVTAGIHWDNMQEPDIQQVLRNVKILARQIESHLLVSSGTEFKKR